MGERQIRSVCLVALLALSVPAVANASGDGEAKHRGSCSGGPGKWRLTVHPVTESKMRIRFAIDGGKPGERWQLFLSIDGDRIFTDTKRADERGDVHAIERAADKPGSHRIEAAGVNVDSGGSCQGSIRY